MCGFVGMVSGDEVAPALLLALQAIQHRGQDAAGVGTFDERRVHLVKRLGKVETAIPARSLDTLVGHAGLAHVRYPTTGTRSTAEDAQPFRSRSPGLLLAHNGNVTNMDELDAWLRREGFVVLSQCDAEPILLTFSRTLLRRRPAGHTTEDVVAAVRDVFERVRGGYTVVTVLEVDGETTLVAFRDPHGIRPGVYGQRSDGAWMAASESVSLDVLGIDKMGDIPPGAVMLLRHDQPARVLPVAPARPAHCVFERVYFARPDSRMEDGRVNRARWRMGRQLAREWRARGLEADLVVAVPDTSRPAAMAVSEELGLPHREGFIKNRYSGRTFIMPDAETRAAALRLKLNPIAEMFAGQRVLLVDDSIVRGTTMKRIVKMVRSFGPEAIHLAIFSPAVRHPCFYGIDMPTTDELIAAQHPPDPHAPELARALDVDSLTYLSVEGMREVAGEAICDACFTGRYPVPVSEAERGAIEDTRRRTS